MPRCAHGGEELPPARLQGRLLLVAPAAPLEDAGLAHAHRLHGQLPADRLDALLDALEAAEQPVAVDQLDQLGVRHGRVEGHLGDAALVQLLHLAQEGHAVSGIPRVGDVPEQDRRMVADPADPVVGHGQVMLHDQGLLRGVHVRGEDLPRADAEVGAHDEDSQLVGHIVEHGGRVVAVMLDDADVGVGQVDELPRQPLALVHVGHGVVAPGHEPRAVEQQPVALGPDLAEAEAGRLGLYGRSRGPGLVERTLQEVEDGLAVRRPAPDHGISPRG